jgi:hypothetical protein
VEKPQKGCPVFVYSASYEKDGAGCQLTETLKRQLWLFVGSSNWVGRWLHGTVREERGAKSLLLLVVKGLRGEKLRRASALCVVN